MLGVSGRWSFRSDTLRLTLAVTGDESGFREGLECDFFSPGASLPLLPRSFLPPSFRMPMYVSYRVCWRGNQRRTAVNTLFTNVHMQHSQCTGYLECSLAVEDLTSSPKVGKSPRGLVDSLVEMRNEDRTLVQVCSAFWKNADLELMAIRWRNHAIWTLSYKKGVSGRGYNFLIFGDWVAPMAPCCLYPLELPSCDLGVTWTWLEYGPCNSTKTQPEESVYGDSTS